jgi:hypothetical protein
MSDSDQGPALSTVIAAVMTLAAIIWLLPLAVQVVWQVIPSILILVLVVGAIRAIVSRIL